MSDATPSRSDPRIVDVEMLVTVRVTITDPTVVDRVVNNEDRWRETFYAMDSFDDVVEHLAYNAISNGYVSAAALDGWADCDAMAARMVIIDCEPA